MDRFFWYEVLRQLVPSFTAIILLGLVLAIAIAIGYWLGQHHLRKHHLNEISKNEVKRLELENQELRNGYTRVDNENNKLKVTLSQLKVILR